jgi:Mg-chelatase subunit ChlI
MVSCSLYDWSFMGNGRLTKFDYRAAGAVAVTVPACWYLLKESPAEAHHLHVPHKVEAHAEPEAEAEEEAKEEETKEEAPKEEESKEEEPKAEAEASTTDNEEEKPSADASKSEDEGKDTTEAAEKVFTDLDIV